MTDGVTLGNGKSRKIKFADLPATYAEFVTAGEAGTLFIDLLMNALTAGDDAGWVALGDYLNKANLLSGCYNSRSWFDEFCNCKRCTCSSSTSCSWWNGCEYRSFST